MLDALECFPEKQDIRAYARVEAVDREPFGCFHIDCTINIGLREGLLRVDMIRVEVLVVYGRYATSEAYTRHRVVAARGED